MSAIAGVVQFDGASLVAGSVERMTAAMAARGPDGLTHWTTGTVGLGHCALHTTPESSEERLPLASADGEVRLVMDGLLDNRDDLRRALRASGVTLRDSSDAELVLCAYETWGDACPARLVGEFVFVVWDARRRRFFGARDAVGTRHFYYCAARGWCAFASEIAGLLALDRIERRLNESRLLDYLVVEYDRDDEVGTFYRGIDRLPAGHAFEADARGLRTWRYWDPATLPPLGVQSLADCAQAFLETFRTAVECRLRSSGPVGAMLSGGLDSSFIVGLIRHRYRAALAHPLRTFSLTLDDRNACLDWPHIQAMLADGWVEPTISTSAQARHVSRRTLDGIPAANEPFALSHGFPHDLVYRAASDAGCRVALDGMAGDVCFYSPERSLASMLQHRRLSSLPMLLAAGRRHGGVGTVGSLGLIALNAVMPAAGRPLYRAIRDRYGRLTAEQRLLRPEVVRPFLAARRQARQRATDESPRPTDQAQHARDFTSGTISFGHEVTGQLALSSGVEPRSPFADRRVIEFAVRMPIDAKFYGPWYKPLLRQSMAGVVPESVRWRRRIDGHPGWSYFEQHIAETAARAPDIWDRRSIRETLAPWIDPTGFETAWRLYATAADYSVGYHLYRLAVLARWITVRRLAP